MIYVDKSRTADLEFGKIFRETVRADIDQQISKMLRDGVPGAVIARALCVGRKRVTRIQTATRTPRS